MRDYGIESTETDRFVRVGEPVAPGEVAINLWHARRLRDLGREVLLTWGNSRSVDEAQLQAAILLRSNAMMPRWQRDPSMPDIYVSALDTTVTDDCWHALIRYNSYREYQGMVGLESDYEIEVMGGEVTTAKRSLYHLRDAKPFLVEVNPNEEVQIVHKRSVLETPITANDIDRLTEKIRIVLARKEQFG